MILLCPGCVGDIDNVDTQPVDLGSLPTPPPTPFKPQSFDDSHVRREKFKGPPKLRSETMELTPATTASTPSPPKPSPEAELLDAAAEELKSDKVLSQKAIVFVQTCSNETAPKSNSKTFQNPLGPSRLWPDVTSSASSRPEAEVAEGAEAVVVETQLKANKLTATWMMKRSGESMKSGNRNAMDLGMKWPQTYPRNLLRSHPEKQNQRSPSWRRKRSRPRTERLLPRNMSRPRKASPRATCLPRRKKTRKRSLTNWSCR